MYETDFSDSKIKNTTGMNMIKFRKYQQKQVNELRNRMKTCNSWLKYKNIFVRISLVKK